MGFPRIRKTAPAEFHARMAVRCDEAAAAYASELSTARDPKRRDFLASQARKNKTQAAFHREQAGRLSGRDA